MTNPQPQPGAKSPARAEPLQPDRPGDQDIDKSDEMSADEVGRRTAEEQLERSKGALENVRKGYGGPAG